jgi:hypothetical protein
MIILGSLAIVTHLRRAPHREVRTAFIRSGLTWHPQANFPFFLASTNLTSPWLTFLSSCMAENSFFLSRIRSNLTLSAKKIC